jgi:hypothetical protein
MFIRTVDEGLARMLRAEIPLPVDTIDISFAMPSPHRLATLSRTTVNLFLYEVLPSGRPAHSVNRRVDQEGRAQRRRALPVVDLNYLVSVWAPDPLDEHQLLGELVSRIAGQAALAPEYLPTEPDSSVLLFLGGDEQNRVRDIWAAIGGGLRASFALSIAVAADSFGWLPEAPPVTRVLGAVGRRTD